MTGDHDHHDDPDPTASGFGRFRDLAGDDPRLKAGVEHLQRAAHEAIAASRALLDVAEDLVEDPRALDGLLDLVGGLGGLAGRLGGSRLTPTGDDEGDDPPVQRIPVS